MAEEQKGMPSRTTDSVSTGTFSESVGKSVSVGVRELRESMNSGKPADVSRPAVVTVPTQTNQSNSAANSGASGTGNSQK